METRQVPAREIFRGLSNTQKTCLAQEVTELQ